MVVFYALIFVSLLLIVITYTRTLPTLRLPTSTLLIVPVVTLVLALYGFDQLYYSLTATSITLTSVYVNTVFPPLLFPLIYVFLFVTTTSLLVTLYYSTSQVVVFSLFLGFISATSTLLFLSNSLILFFVSYECFLLPSFILLFSFAKTRRASEAAFLMFFWTQFGAFFLIISILALNINFSVWTFTALSRYPLAWGDVNFLVLCWLIGFGVKIPIWPFYEWLPKAHVEAPTNFSIFLSGVLVKFAFFGFIKFLLTVQSEPTCFWVLPFLVYGLIDSGLKLCFQVDVKKIIAYATVTEMHWLVLAVLSGQSVLWYSALAMLISHALISSNSFLLVDAIARRFQTRLVTEIYGLSYLTPKLFFLALLNLIIFLGFPGSLFFIAEFLFFSFILDYSPWLFFILVGPVYVLLPVFFFKLWFTMLWSFGIETSGGRNYLDLDRSELILYSFLSFGVFYLGVTWNLWIY